MAASNAKNVVEDSPATRLQNAKTAATYDPRSNLAIQSYLKNGGNIQQAMQSANANADQINKDQLGEYYQKLEDARASERAGGKKGTTDGLLKPEMGDAYALQKSIENQLYSDPRTGTLVATDQVRSNPLFSGFLGTGGVQDQRQADESNIRSNGFNLNAQDQTAFGQAAGNINRQYGAEAGNLARALSSRGFGGADSGVAASQFSGLQGNVSDRMAQAQSALASNRMNFNLQRLTQAQNAVNQAQGMAAGAIGDQFNRNMQGLGMDNAQAQQQWGQTLAQQNQKNAEFQQQQDSGINPGKVLSGLATGAAGALAGGVTGGIGSAFGANLGGGILNSSGQKFFNAQNSGKKKITDYDNNTTSGYPTYETEK